MLLNESGLNLDGFEPVLASVLGDERGEKGCRVLAETLFHRRAQVQLRDWLYCLAKAPGTSIRKRLIEARGQAPERFVAGIEGGIDDENEPKGSPPDELTAKTVAPTVTAFLDRTEALARENGCPKINDAVLTMALLQSADPELRSLLVKWATDEGLKKLEEQLRAEIVPPPPTEVFRPEDGALNLQVFDASGRKFCARLREDAASLGARKISIRHVLYTLLSNETGLLPVALAVRGVDVKKEPHAALARELARPGTKRNDDFAVTRAGSWMFSAGVFVNLTSLANKLKQAADPVSIYIEGQLSKDTRVALLDYAGPTNYPEPLQTRLVEDLNRIIRGQACYDPKRFAGVPLRPETQELLAQHAQGYALVQLNRLLVEDAYPVEISRIPRTTVFPAVEQLLKDSVKVAHERGAKKVGEFDIGRTFVLKQSPELTRLFAANKPLDLSGLQAYVETAEPDADEASQKPVHRLTIQEIETKIKERVLGQEAAVARVIPWVKRLRFGLPRDGRPAGVFLFLGPTGTGKTQLAKELARFVFGDEEMMLFMEMGQFQSKESMSMFIGAPPGYVGYGDGKLTNGLRDKPECIVLFDEIEKAFTEVFDTLLRFADEGVISDPAGPVRDGRKCIIVMTTNAGQGWLRGYLKDNPEARKDPTKLSDQLFEAAMEELKAKKFKPEFLGRVDERITFLPFTLETCRRIVDKELKRELDKFDKYKGIDIEVPEEVRGFLAQKAYERSTDEGARGAPRAVNEWIVTPAIDRLTEVGSEEGGPTKLHASLLGLGKVVLTTDEPAQPGPPAAYAMPADAMINAPPQE